jgi:glycosyltransferase involved in cell wall biosynthesis/histidinol phosphatase-like PHP family hydrolase
MPAERFSIAQVSPYPWEQHHEVNRYVERLSDELCRRGHRVVVIAPSSVRELIREGREMIARTARDPDSIFAAEGCAQFLAIGQSLPARRGGSVSVPVDVSKAMEQLLGTANFDFVHVHEPFAPSAASAALRHSHALNVGTFHAPTERVVSTQVARRIVELLFGRLDGRTASFSATRDLVARYFPGDYRVIHPGADLVERPVRGDHEIVDILYSAEEERAALRLFLRALRKLPVSLPWRATIWSRERDLQLGRPVARAIRDRVRFAGPADGSEAQHLAAADIAVAASSGAAPAPQLLFRAMAGGAVPVASRLPTYEEALREGDRGLLFEPRDTDTLARQLERLVREPKLLATFHDRIHADHPELEWSRAADEFEELYASIAARRKPVNGTSPLRKRLQSKALIDVDLHMHTDHSADCATPVEVLLETAKERGLGAIAVTDHNVISGAHEARARANGIKVIVAEEVKTAGQGEVIGLFIEDHIPRGMTLEETIAEIHRQGGLVYVPHPFDRMHAVPDYEHLLTVLEDVDAIEVFNARVAVPSFNEEAVKFARKYRIPGGAGSDSHVPQGLGSVRIRMRDFDGPEEFLESLREADIIRKPTSLLYVQTLKFLQTKAPGGRKRKATGKR